MGSAALAELGAVEAGATQSDQIKKWDYEAGVVVLGIGAAGLMTAITAYDQGADVLILEKAPEAHAGGNTRVSGQGYWCPSDSNKAVEYQKAMSDGYPIPDDMAQGFPRTLDPCDRMAYKNGRRYEDDSNSGRISGISGRRRKRLLVHEGERISTPLAPAHGKRFQEKKNQGPI